METREEKKQTTADLILDTAIELFIRDGFEKTPMDAIALEAKVAKGTLYYHFDSKEGIIKAIIERYICSVEKDLEDILQKKIEDPFKRLKLFVDTMKRITSATFSKLHRLKYIDIHEKTAIAMIDRLAPYLAKFIELGNEAKAWNVEHPLEFAEMQMVLGIFFYDPEHDQGRYLNRIELLLNTLAMNMKINVDQLKPVFQGILKKSKYNE